MKTKVITKNAKYSIKQVIDPVVGNYYILLDKFGDQIKSDVRLSELEEFATLLN